MGCGTPVRHLGLRMNRIKNSQYISCDASYNYVRCKWKECYETSFHKYSEVDECFQLHGPNTASIQLVHEEELLAHTESTAELGPKPAKLQKAKCFWSMGDTNDFCHTVFIPSQAIIYLACAPFWRNYKKFTVYTFLLIIHKSGKSRNLSEIIQKPQNGKKRRFTNWPKITFICQPECSKICAHCFCIAVARKIVPLHQAPQIGVPSSEWWARLQCSVPAACLCSRFV